MCSVKAATCCVARLKKTCLAVPWEFVPDRTERHTALHVGEVPYGNVGAVDRLDFTVIGPAVNEVVRIEKSVSLLANRSCSHLGSLRLRDTVTDASSHSDILSCAASMKPRRYLDCGPPGPWPCNARKLNGNTSAGEGMTGLLNSFVAP